MGPRLILGIILLVADIWAFLKILQSPVTAARKAAWILIILIVPYLGLIIWYFLGPRGLPLESGQGGKDETTGGGPS